MVFIKQKNRRFLKILVIAVFGIFTTTQTAGTAFSAGLLPGFYGSTSSNITAPQINSLPSLRNIVQGVSSLEYIDDNQLIIHQNESNAIIEWDSFDIGVNAWTHFDQQNDSSWKALNRIFDQDPSLIYGKLTSDGHVYLINQNGIFFSPNSKVNVGSLVASSLNISDDDFLDETRTFKKENYINPGESVDSEGVVSNHGVITTDDGGSVFLLGSIVENNGDISAYLGWAALAAGDEITIHEYVDKDNLSNYDVYQKIYITENPGLVQNFEDGTIAADRGRAGMYGSNVIQDGIIRSETSVTSQGIVELRASEKIILGEGSLTAAPVSDSAETYSTSESMKKGNVYAGELLTDPGSQIDDDSDDDYIFPDLIDLEGTVYAPYGLVDLKTIDRLYLGENSIIDVSGLWVTRPVSDKSMLVQLNSVELSDDYAQKDGELLGKKLTISTLLGSNIGNVSNYILNGIDETAQEKSTAGGVISLYADSGDIIFREGALLDASGGGINYSSGYIDSAKLVSINNMVYDIDNAPEWETYTGQLLGEFTQTNERYGSETYSGIYYGSATPLKSYVEGFQEGSDAGEIYISAPAMILDGTIDTTVTKGLYQTMYSTGLTGEEITLYEAMGILTPEGGSLQLGGTDTSVTVNTESSNNLEKLTVDSGINSLSGSFNPEEDPFPEEREGTTYISSDLINNAGISNLKIYSNINISINVDEEISLLPGGEFSASSRSMTVEGSVSVPGGTIELNVTKNNTSDSTLVYISPEEIGRQRLFLGPESTLSTAGERIDNSEYGINDTEYKTGLINGGTITIYEQIPSRESLVGDGDGVIISEGAYIDVSGGWSIDSDGGVSGGNAGTLDIGGSSVILDGDIAGYSMSGEDGGTINIHAGSISILTETDSFAHQAIGVDDDIPELLKYLLVLDDSFFDSTGFSNINLYAANEINLASGAELRPSYLKYFVSKGEESLEEYGTASTMVYSMDPDVSLITVSEQYLGSSSVGLYTMDSFFERINITGGSSHNVYINPGAVVKTGLDGAITIEGASIESSGSLSAPGGTIDINAETGLTLASGSIVSAEGYILQDLSPLTTDLPMGYSVKDGGSVSLTSSGSITIEQGAVVDISGSDIVMDYKWAANGDVVTEEKFSAPGSLSLSFFTDLSIDSDSQIYTTAEKDGVLNGGTLLLTKTSLTDSFEISGEDLNLFVDAGFDSITLKSLSELTLDGSMDVYIPADLTIDTPILSASDGSNILLGSSWITLSNSFKNYNKWATQGVQGDDETILRLQGDFIDINGLVTLSSFGTAELVSATDIRLSSDYEYYNRNSQFIGGLIQTGDLNLQADRIYGKTLSYTEIRSTGDLTILDNGDTLTGDIYSAGAEISLSASNIYNYDGDIYAPYGAITLTATGDGGIVYLGDGSTLGTYSGGYINYGVVDENIDEDGNPKGLFWLTDEVNKVDIEEAPTGSISISGDSVITADGSVIDVSAGGTVFAYLFQESITGTEDPLGKSGQYVLLPDNSIYSPVNGSNRTITIGTNSLIPAGTYNILGDEYAFVEGAIVITDLGTDPALAKETETVEGYTIVSGRDATVGTGLSSGTETHYYSVRSAVDVLDEGEFQIFEEVAGNGGSISLQGNTTIIEGAITGNPLSEEYTGGTLTLSGKNMTVTAGDAAGGYSLPDDFDPEEELEDQIEDMMGRLFIADSSISGQGMGDVILGNQDTTETITLEEGVSLQINRIELNSKDVIEIKDNAEVMAVSENGSGDVIFNNPDGSLSIGESVLIQASDNIELNTGTFHILGDLKADEGSISIISGSIYFISDEAEDITAAGGYITQSLWASMSSAQTIEIGSGSELYFMDSFDLTSGSEFILDASLVDTAGSEISIESGSVTLCNSGDTSGVALVSGSGTLSIDADNLYLGSGTVSLSGFSGINLESSGDITVQGSGGLETGDADLDITAISLKSSLLAVENEAEDTVDYYVMDYSINAGEGAVTISPNGGEYVTPSTSGGRFGISAKSITQTGMVNMPGAYITYEATGDYDPAGIERDGIFIENGAEIYAAGNEYAPGGSVSLVSENGIVTLAQGSEINVAAGDQGEAGEVEIYSPTNAAVIHGALTGNGNSGTGGSFTLDTAEIADFSALNTILSAGGFTSSLDIRARQGNITLETADTVSAGEITLSADGFDGSGNIDIRGAIDATEAEYGSRVNIYAGNTLTLFSGSSITGSASGAEILLSGEEAVNFEEGAVIYAGSASDASVAFRSVRSSDSELNMTLRGEVLGADSVTAESVKVYNVSDGTVDTEISTWMTETAEFMENAAVLKTTLFNDLETEEETRLYLAPVLDVRSTGNLTVKDWTLGGSSTYGSDSDGYYNLTDTWHYDTDGDGTYETAGTLYLRAADNLTIAGSITDLLAVNTSLYKDARSAGWNIGLSAGADFAAADLMKTVSGSSTGDLTINSQKLVYTERGNLSFSSARDTVVNTINSNKIVSYSDMGFNLATYDGWILGDTGNSLKLLGGAIQSSLGDIDLDINGDLTLKQVKVSSTKFQGTIRSVGAQGSEEIDIKNYYAYIPGGRINLNVAGAIDGKPEKSAQWDTVYYDYSSGQFVIMASFGNAGSYGTQGIVSMSGGDMHIRSGGDIIAAMGNFGDGDLSIYSNGDLNGRFLVTEGMGTLYAAGNAGTSPDLEDQEIGLHDAYAALTAQGNVELGTILNPSLAYAASSGTFRYLDNMWNLTYSPDTEITIRALSGDIELTGKSGFYSNSGAQDQGDKAKVLPGNLSLEAGRDIILDADFYMAPSPNGQLSLNAGRDISGKGKWIVMSDMDMDSAYSYLTTEASNDIHRNIELLKSKDRTLGTLHEDDESPVLINAGRDINRLRLYLPKKAEITAGRDILDLKYSGQNVNSDDISLIKAGEKILFSSIRSDTGEDSSGQILQGGPGILMVLAGESIDLGTSDGIQMLGSSENAYLPATANDLIVISGLEEDIALAEFEDFFESLKVLGKEYSELLEEGKEDEAMELLEKIRQEKIYSLTGEIGEERAVNSGDIDMTNSQISVKAGSGGIYMLAMGDINVGRSLGSTAASESGIYTVGGGLLNIFAAYDLNVNESRVMTLGGGDIAVWTDQGDINAGLGSKTTITGASRYLYVDEYGNEMIRYQAPAVGSGIRTSTYDPDGDAGPLETPPAGDVYLIAPSGKIDVGEAGISGSNVILAATEVLNAQNISFSQGSVGVPIQTASVNIGPIGGTSSITDTGMAEDATASMAADRNEALQQAMSDIGDLLAKMLSVEVVGFYAEKDDEEK